MTRAIAFKPGAEGKYGKWIKASLGSGLCFTLHFAELESLLQRINRINHLTEIERVEIDGNGLTIFLKGEL